jgi:uncharacterized protein (TIGR02996 family)
VTEIEALAAIYADPARDEPRSVYADWLVERGDPRGEFIALQLARKSGPPTKREKELEWLHGRSWLGPLAGKVDPGSVRFERGFVASASVLDDLDGDPAWSTLVEIWGGVPSASCRAPSLRAIRNLLGDAKIVKLLDRQDPLAVEELDWGGPMDGHRRLAIRAFQKTTVLPRLRRLSIEGEDTTEHAWAWTSPVSARLEELEITSVNADLTATVEALAPTKIARVSIGTRSMFEIAVSRDAKGELSRLELFIPVPWAVSNVTSRLLQIPTTLATSIRVEIRERAWQKGDRQGLKRAMDRQTRLVEPPTIVKLK